jgi:predicted branched-subunit amino acid permease
MSGKAANKAETFGVNLTAQASWVAGTIIGVGAGGLISDVRPIGLDFALPAMFIALLVLQIRGAAHLLVAVAAGAASTGLALAGADRWNVVLATVFAATLGLGIWRWTRR